MSDRSLSCAESEGVRLHNVDLDLIKAGNPEAPWKCTGVRYHHRVEEVKKSKRTAVKDICARENAAGTENPSDFGPQTVLQCFRRDVMEHRETHRSIKCRVWDGHSCRYALGELPHPRETELNEYARSETGWDVESSETNRCVDIISFETTGRS